MWSIPLVQSRVFLWLPIRIFLHTHKKTVNTWPFHLLNVCRRTSGLIVLIQDTAQSFLSGGFFLLTPAVLMNETFATHWRARTRFHYWLIVAIELHDKKDPEMIPLTVISIKVDEMTIKHDTRQPLYLDRQEYELILGIFWHLLFAWHPFKRNSKQHWLIGARRRRITSFSLIGFNVVIGHFWSHCSKHIFNPRLAFFRCCFRLKTADQSLGREKINFCP